jgi:hypothetical protein
MEFKSFSEIKRLNSIKMQITQKLHGTNAIVCIYKDENGELQLKTGSRTRWIAPGNDNYGFAAFVYANKQEFIDKLGEGLHFGEYTGPGINSGEGLSEKLFILFDYWRYDPNNLPTKTVLVPVLYDGPVDTAKIKEVMDDLKTNGSKLVSGFMRPEGVVVSIGNTRYKIVFEAEETQWKKSSGVKVPKIIGLDYSHLCQPMRLEKLLSRDEEYVIKYPESIRNIAFDYFDDLLKEGQVVGTEAEIAGVKKQALNFIFPFIKEFMNQRGIRL